MKAIEFSQKLQYYSHLSGVRKTAFIIICVQLQNALHPDVCVT